MWFRPCGLNIRSVMNHCNPFTTLIVAGTLCVAAPAAAAPYQDMRSPDARDAARSAEAPQDMRSPDTRDAAEPPPAAARPASPPASSDEPAEFPWPEAGFAAAVLLGCGATTLRRVRRAGA